MTGALERNSDLVWRDEPERRDEILAALVEGREVGDEGWVIVVEGGEIHQLNLIAGEIWMLCDGTRDEAAISAALLEAYDADASEVTADVAGFVTECIDKGWLERKD